MKKFFVSLAALMLAAGLSYAQDLSEATETAKSAVEAFESGNKTRALALFNQALELATACGEAGNDIVSQCKAAIPTISLSLAKEEYNAKNFVDAAKMFAEAAAVAEKYEAFDVVEEATSLIPKAYFGGANALLNNKQFAEAVELYKKVIELEPENANAILRLGMALNGAGNTEEAISTFLLAKDKGKEKDAVKQLCNIYTKQAAASLKGKKFAEAVEAAGKIIDLNPENAQAYQIAGQASQLAGKNADAISYFEKYLELAPTAKNAGQIAYTVGALYQSAKNNAKAKEYYQKAVTDPKYGAEAAKLLNSLK